MPRDLLAGNNVAAAKQPKDLLAQQSQTLQDANLATSDMFSQAGENLLPSAKQFASDMVQPILHPIETAKSVGNLMLGAAQKLIPGEQPEEQYADAVAQFFVDRYGSVENAKKTFAEDPVGLAADLSMLFTGGGSLAARAPGIVGKVGRATETVGRAVDPIRAAGKTVGYGASAAIGNLGTHTGGESLRIAAQAGSEGGSKGRAFLDNLRSPDAGGADVVADAKKALGKIREKRGLEYRIGKLDWAADQTPLDFTPLDKTLKDIQGVKTFKGQDISESTAGIRQKLTDTVNDWRALDPKEYHTPEGFDALKQKVGDIRDSLPYGTPERKVADEVYRTVWQQIQKQSPKYAQAMKQYEDASNLIREIEGTLSLNPKARIDTSLRKLQSILRNNANTNYGRRAELGRMLSEAGAENLMAKLAGQGLSSLTPRGLGKLVASGTAASPALGMTSIFDPTLVGALAVQSPRLMGEAAYYSGKLGYPATAGAFQTGRTKEIVTGAR